MIDLSPLRKRWHVTFRDFRGEERHGFYSGKKALVSLWVTSTSGGTAGWWVSPEAVVSIAPPAKEQRK